jgi:hypothetical protein
MSATRDPDRIFRAWLEQMPDEAPDRAIAAVIQATAGAPQVRSWPRVGPWRPQMNRLSLIATTAVVALALVGGAILLTSGGNGPAPAPSPSLAPTPTPRPTVEPVVAFPEELWGLWAAEPGPISGLPSQDKQILALFNWDGGRDFSVADYLQSDALASNAGEFRLRARDDTHGCASGEVGTYAWQRSANGLFLTVTLVSDPCLLRGTTLTRTWVRTLGVANDGRTGMATFGDPYPYMQVTLSSTAWAMDALPPIDIHRINGTDPGRDFIVYVNPKGLGEPCSTPGGQPFALEPTAEALAAYLEGLPGMGPVTSKPATIDGRLATHITSTVGECQDAELALITQPSFPGSNGGTEEVRAPKGFAVSLWTTVIDGDLVVVWYAGENVPAAEEQGVIDSIRFTDGLPTP